MWKLELILCFFSNFLFFLQFPILDLISFFSDIDTSIDIISTISFVNVCCKSQKRFEMCENIENSFFFLLLDFLHICSRRTFILKYEIFTSFEKNLIPSM